MKKLFVSIFIGLALFVNTAFAQAENEYIMDFANILSDSEEQVLDHGGGAQAKANGRSYLSSHLLVIGQVNQAHNGDKHQLLAKSGKL